jgi:hypothetical protein
MLPVVPGKWDDVGGAWWQLCRLHTIVKYTFWFILQVEMRFDARFHRSFIKGFKYNVCFSIKRTSFVFMHEAVEVRGTFALSGPGMFVVVERNPRFQKQGSFDSVSPAIVGLGVPSRLLTQALVASGIPSMFGAG